MIKEGWNENIFSAIERISPKAKDVLLFYAATDKDGNLICDIMDCKNQFDKICSILDDGVSAILLPDKIYLFSVKNGEEMIESLRNCISAIQEAMDKAVDIENGELREAVKIDLKNAEGPV